MIPLNNLIARCDVVCIRRLLHNGPDTLEELLDRHLAKEQKPTLDDDESELLNRRRLTSTRREALSLYRDILRAFPVLHVDRFAGLPVARHTERERPEGVRSCPVRDRPGNRDPVASWWSRCCGIGSRKARRET